jgi:raffinose/stachyose/melibiose transport system permease protein
MIANPAERLVWHSLRNIMLFIGLAVILFPMYLVIINSFKTLEEASQNFFALPKAVSLANVQALLNSQNYFRYVGNSVLVAVLSMGVVAVFVPLVSYAIARNLKKRYYKFLYMYMLLGLFIPSQVILLPIVKQMAALKLMNQWGLILLYITFSLTRGAFLFVNYIRALPIEIEEAAQIDGCNVLQTYFRIVIHLIKPMISTLVIMDILWYWNDFMLPLFLLNKSRDMWTLPLFQYNFKTEYSFDYPMAFTAYLLALLPVLVVYCACQKHIINGLTAGAVKS